MPLFTFECQDCEENFEKLISFSQSTNSVVCPICRGQNTQKQLSLVARTFSAASSGAAFSAPSASCSTGGG